MQDKPLKLIPTCVKLRHKMMYVDDAQARPGAVDDQSDTRVFWCMVTMDSLGPDDQPVAPDTCADRRTCFCTAE